MRCYNQVHSKYTRSLVARTIVRSRSLRICCWRLREATWCRISCWSLVLSSSESARGGTWDLSSPEAVRAEYARALQRLGQKYAHCHGSGVLSMMRVPAGKSFRDVTPQQRWVKFSSAGDRKKYISTPLLPTAEGRTPEEIESSVNVRFDREAGPGAAAEEAATWFEAGVDLVIVGMPAPYDPADVEALAGALSDLAEASSG